MPDSVWFIHPNLPYSTDAVVYGGVGTIFEGLRLGSDRAELSALGITANTNRPDKIQAFLTYYDRTLAGQSVDALDPIYTDYASSRDGSNAEPLGVREWIVAPAGITQQQAESLISPAKV